MDFAALVDRLIVILESLLGLITVLVVMYFFWQVIVTWIFAGGSEEAIKKGRNTVLVGFVVLIAVFGLWGIVNILAEIINR